MPSMLKGITKIRRTLSRKQSEASIDFNSSDNDDFSSSIGPPTSPGTPTSLIPTAQSKRHRRAYKSSLSSQTRLPTLISTSRGNRYALDPQLSGPSLSMRSSTTTRPTTPSEPNDNYDALGITRFSPVKDPAASHLQYRNKQRRQWENWMRLLPSLVQDYLDLLYLTEDMKHPPSPVSATSPCSCEHTRRVDVVCVFFDKLEDIEIRACTCNPAPKQLIRRGLFCCSPIHPSLAVDIRMLEFVTELYVRMPPNQTAWCEALEHVLRKRDYSLKTRDTLRKRFSNALQWFRLLEAHATDFVAKTASGFDDSSSSSRLTEDLTIRRPLGFPQFDDAVVGQIPSSSQPSPSRGWHRTPRQDRSTTASSAYGSPPSSPTPLQRLPSLSREHADEPASPASSQPSNDAPSSYLRQRCPLCFGGEEVLDVVVCLDACFTQKRTKNSDNPLDRDPPRIHPNTAFLSEEYVNDVESYVELRRTTSTRRQPSTAASNLEDGLEPGMTLPTSVLNSCNDSFVAADEKREKASTTFFVDTGLMAILCRHDHPLWLANMKHAGERQHYAIALIQRLFEDIPTYTHVKLLYDIGCQTHRSFEKYDFLPQYRSRITFAVSVFHAYGHQWPCQLLYHPRKREGFGLSDGEGSERLWHALSLLIAINRVSGHYQRQLNIDVRLRYLNDKATFNHAKWEVRRWNHAEDLMKQASKELEECGVAVDILQKEWKAQITEQTRPLERQSKNKGNAMIDKVLGLYKMLDIYRDDRLYLARQIADALCPAYLQDDYTKRLQQAVELERTTSAEIAKLTHALGTTDRDRLTTLRNDPFLTLLLNAIAVKQRLCFRVVERKFEFRQIDRSCRRTLNDEKLSDHARQAAKRREAGISQLLATFNKLVAELQKMVDAGKAPKGYKAPATISKEGLFGLDVDDEIWMDIGLPKEDEVEKPVPRWLGDENVRKGIRAMLLVDRCEEEKERVENECWSLQEWMIEEWRAVGWALDQSHAKPYMQYHLRKVQSSLVTLCAIWEKKLRALPFWPDEGSVWGPPDELVVAAMVLEAGKKGKGRMEDIQGEDEYLADFDEDNPYVDTELLDGLEATGYMEYEGTRYGAYATPPDAPGKYLVFPQGFIDSHYVPSTPNASPTKRKRRY